MIDKQTVLDRLDFRAFYQEHVKELKVNGKAEALGLCPFHDDTTASLSVNIEKGLYHCFACDAKGDAFSFFQKAHGVDFQTALKELADYTGVTEAAPVKQKVVASFTYRDAEGKPPYTKERLEPGRNGRSKEFRFYHLKDGKRKSDRGGVPVLYNLPEVLRADYCFLVEGEGKADLLTSWGLTATCLDSGASSPWRDEYTASLKKIIILPDADTPGRASAARVARILYNAGKKLKVVELPGLGEREDIIDWSKRESNDKKRLLEIVKAAPEYIPPAEPEQEAAPTFDFSTVLRKGADIRALEIPIEWIVKDILPKGSVTMFYARGGMGKTTLTMQKTDAVSRGVPFLGLETEKTPVIYIDFENSLAVLSDRLKKAGAADVLFWTSTDTPPKLDRADWQKYHDLLKEYPGALLVFDTLRSSQGGNENDSQEMGAVMGKLRELRDAGATVLVLHHTAKSSEQRYKGSTAIFDMVDHVLAIYPVKKGTEQEVEDDDEDGEEKVYRFGTKDKTRYAPFRMFLTFDKEKGIFIPAPDPDEEDMESMHGFIIDMKKRQQKTPNQKDIIERAKAEDIPEKKARRLLKKGEGRYWTLHKGTRTEKIYEPLSLAEMSPYIGASFCHSQSDSLEAGNNIEQINTGESGVNTELGRNDAGRCQAAILDKEPLFFDLDAEEVTP